MRHSRAWLKAVVILLLVVLPWGLVIAVWAGLIWLFGHWKH